MSEQNQWKDVCNEETGEETYKEKKGRGDGFKREATFREN